MSIVAPIVDIEYLLEMQLHYSFPWGAVLEQHSTGRGVRYANLVGIDRHPKGTYYEAEIHESASN